MRTVVVALVLGVVVAGAAIGAGVGLVPSVRQQACEIGDRLTGRSDCLRYAKGEKYAAFVATAKAAITRNFKDPATAQWRNVFVSHPSDGAPALCGEVNARNGFGAYVGFRSFYFHEGWIEPLPMVAEDQGSEFFEKMKAISCSARAEALPDQVANK